MFCVGCIISVLYECKTEGTKQAKIVATIFRSIDKACEEVSDETASHIARGAKNPSGYLMDALGNLSVDSYNEIADYFRDQVVVLIKENERHNVSDTLILMIRESQDIADDTVVDVVNGVTKADLTDEVDLASFLAGVFLFALKNTKNNIGGSAKNVTKEYFARVKKGEKPVSRKTAFNLEEVNDSKPESEHSRFDSHTRKIELLEERIEQEAISFCRKYKEEKEYIALCQVAFIMSPTIVHHREIYNEFCELPNSTRNKILKISEVDKIKVSGDDWWYKYLDMFKKDYEKYALGSERYRYSFSQYFPKLLEYGGERIDGFTQRLFSPKIITPIMKTFQISYKHDVAGLIDEYLYYKDYEKYNNILEPPLDFMWRELNFGSCSELMLTVFLALFIIGTCQGIPLPQNAENQPFVFSGVGTPDLKTAEDLFYQTILTLYENYEVCSTGLSSIE